MNQSHTGTAAPGMKLGDLFYVIFRHKWKIIILSLLSIGGAIALPFVRPAPYESEAKLYIRYVVESSSPGQVGDNSSKIRSPDMRGDSILNTEIEILTSMDLAQEVAGAIGPDKVLAKLGGGADPLKAAVVIQRRISAAVPLHTSVICLSFKHPDARIVQPVLRSLIDVYFKKHAQIHAVGAFDEFLTQETDVRRTQVAQTEEELRKAKSKAGIISLDGTKATYSAELARLQEQLFDTQAELADHQAALGEMRKSLQENLWAPTNEASTATVQSPVPPEKVEEYRRACVALDSLYHREQELLVTFTPANSFVQDIRARITAQEQRKKQLEQANPGLLAIQVTITNSVGTSRMDDPRTGIAAESARVQGLESRVKVLKDQLQQVKTSAAALANDEGTITELQRRLQLQETNYTRFAQSLDQSQIDEKLGAGKVSNISTIQEPTAPLADRKKLLQFMAGVLFGGIAAAFGFPFLIEFYLDNSIKRPIEVQTKIGLPLFISIPRLSLGEKKRLKERNQAALLAEGASNNSADHAEMPSSVSNPGEIVVSGKAEMAPWDPRHILRPFCEALRDGLITFFEVNNLTHKPKLVAVTSCSHGAGVSTVAVGLAASLSETGEGNVLLVDMNQKNGEVHQFYKGDLACDLDDVLELEKRDQALVQRNLYIASETASGNGDQLPVILPKRFKELVPRLRASDYDYIIFDMPPVNQISPTQRLARFMDMVLMVVESEKTNRDAAKSAGALLTSTKANVGAVLNKSRTYIPRWLHQEV